MKKVRIIKKKKCGVGFVNILCLYLGVLVFAEKDDSTGIMMGISWMIETSKNPQNFREAFPLLLVILLLRVLA